MARFDAGTIEAVLRLRDEFTGVAKRVATQAKTLGDRIERSGAAMGRAGSALAPLSLGVAALGVGALKAAIDFESSFAGVIKTVDDATDSMGRLTPVGEKLRQGFRDLALEIPVSANELAGIGEVAGQLGIETQNIAGFTETMAKLGVTTNLSAQEAATALARLANVTGLPQTEFERLGSTVVALGNNLETTESEIVMFGQRIAGAGAIAGLSEPQILAIGGAMSSVGIEAEAGGTAVQKVLLTMNDAVAAGGAELARFADLSGQSVEQFAAGWRDNAGAQFTAFVEGLAAQGDQASAVLKELIGTDQRLQRAFLSLAQSGDTLRNAMSLANVAWVENTALAKEAEIRFQTTGAQLTILWNNVKDVAISLGDALLPTLKDTVGFLQESVVPVLRDAAEWFEDLSTTSKRLAAGFAALIVVATPVLFTLSTMAPLLSVIAGGFAAIVPSAAAAGAAVGASGTAAAKARVQFDALFATQQKGAVVGGRLAGRLGTVGRAGLVAAAAFSGWQLGSWIRQALQTDKILVDLRLRLMGLSQAEREAFHASEELLEQNKPLIQTFHDMRDELEALAAKEMAAWANASEEAKERARELAASLPDTEVAMQNLVAIVRQFQSEGKLTPDVLRNIAKQALALGIAVEDLAPELQNIVISFDNTARAAREAAEEEARLERESTRLKESIQELVNEFQGRGLIHSALAAAEAVRHVGGVSTLTADDQDQLRETMEGAIDAYRRLGQTAPPAVQTLSDELRVLERANQELARAVQRHQVINEKSIDQFLEMNRVGTEYVVNLDTLVQGTVEAEAATVDADQAFGHLDTTVVESIKTTSHYEIALASLAGQLGGAAGQSLNLAISMREADKQTANASEQFGKIRIGAAIAGAALQTLGDAIGGTAGAILSEVGNIATAFASGGVVGAVIAGIGAAIKGLKALFSVSQAEKDARAFADAYADTIIKTLTTSQLAEAADAALGAWRGNERGAQFLIGVRDGFVAAGRSAAEAEQLVGRYWKAVRDGSPEAVKAIEAQIDAVVKVGQAVQELQAFDSATDQLQQLTSAAEFFGVAAEEMGARLGNAFQAVEQAATAEDIAQHFHTLLASGVDLGTALDLAKDKVQGVIAASVQMGTEIPASMQPIAAQLIAQGQLLDDSGQKITDINQLEFGTSMTEGLQILVLSMNQLVETMGGEIPAAAKQFAEGVGQSATAAGASLDQQLLAQIANIGLAVHDLSVEDLAQMAAAFEATAQAAGLSLEGVLGEQLDALTTGLGSMSRDALPELVRSFQQTATDAVQAFDRIPRTLTFEHRTRYSSSGLPGATTRSGFQSGTAGRFVDFGVGTAVVLHGRERVVTEAEGRREAADLGALRQELADLKRVMARDQDELPFRLSRAIRDAMAETV